LDSVAIPFERDTPRYTKKSTRSARLEREKDTQVPNTTCWDAPRIRPNETGRPNTLEGVLMASKKLVDIGATWKLL